MKHLRKSILTLLALTLFGGAGAWAQGPTQVTQITTDMIASWATDENNITLADLQAIGFVATDYNTAAAWTGAPQSGSCYLYYAISGSEIAYVYFTAGSVNDHDQSQIVKAALYHDISQGAKYFYTGSPAIELTPDATGRVWTLGQTPDYDLELQVEYYEAHALKDIPAGWTVMVNGVAQTQPYQGDSLMITETDSVTLIPAGNPRRVKSVTLEEDVPPTITVTINQSDWAHGNSFTKDGVTVSANDIDPNQGNLMFGGSFSTTLGNFTSIVVTSGYCDASGTGWSGSYSSMTWTGTPASSVSFSGNFMGMGQTQTTIVCTIVPTN